MMADSILPASSSSFSLCHRQVATGSVFQASTQLNTPQQITISATNLKYKRGIETKHACFLEGKVEDTERKVNEGKKKLNGERNRERDHFFRSCVCEVGTWRVLFVRKEIVVCEHGSEGL
jgi:hypothetical protein